MRPQFKMFRGTFTSWGNLFQDAVDFATQLQPDQLIGIHHSADRADGVVTVWYWQEATAKRTPSGVVRYRMFRSTFYSWEALYGDAAEFAAGLTPAQLIGISHSDDKGDGVVVVWYRDETGSN